MIILITACTKGGVVQQAEGDNPELLLIYKKMEPKVKKDKKNDIKKRGKRQKPKLAMGGNWDCFL